MTTIHFSQVDPATTPVFYDASRLNRLTVIPSSVCPQTGCSTCLLPHEPVSFRYTSGDVILASLAGGHHDGIYPLSCNVGRKDKLVSLAAVEWAVSRYRVVNPNSLNGLNLGSLVADICSNPAIGQGFLSDLMISKKIIDESGAMIPSDNIVAFVDDTGERRNCHRLVLSSVIEFSYLIVFILPNPTTLFISGPSRLP